MSTPPARGWERDPSRRETPTTPHHPGGPLRRVSRGARRGIIGKRDRQQRIFDEVVEDGGRAGAFAIAEPLEASRAIVTMCTAVASWYRRTGPMSAEQIVDTYRDLALNIVG